MNSSARIARSEILDLCQTTYAAGPLPVFGAQVLGLFLCVRLTLILAETQPCPRSCSPRSTASGKPPPHGSSPPARP